MAKKYSIDISYIKDKIVSICALQAIAAFLALGSSMEKKTKKLLPLNHLKHNAFFSHL